MSRNVQTQTEPQNKERSAYFRLDEATYEQLATVAREMDLPMSTVVRSAIREYLKRHRA